jgi:hypothetical protein
MPLGSCAKISFGTHGLRPVGIGLLASRAAEHHDNDDQYGGRTPGLAVDASTSFCIRLATDVPASYSLVVW